jgi:hypothetical protein
LRDSRWLDARLLTDALELIESQPAGFGGQRRVARAARCRETENLAYLLVAVSTLIHMIDCTVAACHALAARQRDQWLLRSLGSLLARGFVGSTTSMAIDRAICQTIGCRTIRP